MAIVTSISPITKDRIGRPATTACGYCKVEIDGKEYLVLESYGSPARAYPNKTSQSFHFDRDSAADLKRVLAEAFPGI